MRKKKRIIKKEALSRLATLFLKPITRREGELRKPKLKPSTSRTSTRPYYHASGAVGSHKAGLEERNDRGSSVWQVHQLPISGLECPLWKDWK